MKLISQTKTLIPPCYDSALLNFLCLFYYVKQSDRIESMMKSSTNLSFFFKPRPTGR